MYFQKMQHLSKVFTLSLLVLASSKPALADAIPIYESRVDHYRTGANLKETLLNTGNVNAQNFGLLFTLPVNGVFYITSPCMYPI